jgi:hypothetical protein
VAASSNPDAATVMGSFDVVALAGVKLDLIRRRIQQQTLGRRAAIPEIRSTASAASPEPAPSWSRPASTNG